MQFLAQVEPVAASAPWLSFIIQCGSFGLICYIIAVMWPRSQTETRHEREKRDERFEQMLKTLHEKFSERNEKIVTAVRDQTKEFTRATNESAVKIVTAIDASCKAHIFQPGSGRPPRPS